MTHPSAKSPTKVTWEQLRLALDRQVASGIDAAREDRELDKVLKRELSETD